MEIRNEQVAYETPADTHEFSDDIRRAVEAYADYYSKKNETPNDNEPHYGFAKQGQEGRRLR